MTATLGWLPSSQQPLQATTQPLLAEALTCVELVQKELLEASPEPEFGTQVSLFQFHCLKGSYWKQLLSGAVDQLDQVERTPLAEEFIKSSLSFKIYQSALRKVSDYLCKKVEAFDCSNQEQIEICTALAAALAFEEQSTQGTYLQLIEYEIQQHREGQRNVKNLIFDFAHGRSTAQTIASYTLPQELRLASTTLQEHLEQTRTHVELLAQGMLQRPHLNEKGDYILEASLQQLETRNIQLTNAIEQMSQGEFNLTLDTKGDTDAIAKSFNQLASNFRAVITQVDSVARGEYQEDIVPLSDHDLLGAALQKMTQFLRVTAEENRAQLAIIEGLNNLNDVMRRDSETPQLCADITGFLARFSKASVGVLYVQTIDETQLQRLGSYALSEVAEKEEFIIPGQGLIGQVAKDLQLVRIKSPQAQRLKIRSGLVDDAPNEIMLFPLALGNKCVGVLELGYLQKLDPAIQKFIELTTENIAIAIERSQSRSRASELLAESNALTSELQGQRTEIMAANRQLEEQTRLLETSEEQLQQQSTELESTNRTLERHNETLEAQSVALDKKNDELQNTQEVLEAQAAQLALSSRYKSEFLANMSHELRTPLNSMLLLAKHLADNAQGHLDEQEVESASIVYSSGNDLLSLINEILDLAKVEAGKMAISVQDCPLSPLLDNLKKSFSPLAAEKSLTLELDGPKDLVLMTDCGRLEQVLRNLLSNAIKFTATGSVSLQVALADEHKAQQSVQFTVTDTGMGIPSKMKAVIFEAFQQVEGGIDRQHGGTGLGLSISRELAALLGGKLELLHSDSSGSSFQLTLPLKHEEAEHAIKEENLATAVRQEKPVAKTKPVAPPLSPDFIEDDRTHLLPEETTLLIIEDDSRFASILRDLCRRQGFQVLVAQSGEEGLELVQKFKPQGILLDLQLPGMDGFSVLDELKSDPRTRHIAVHIISVEEENLLAYRKGAIGFLQKPVSEEQIGTALQRLETTFGRAVKELLIIEDNDAMRHAMRTLLGNGDIHTTESKNGADAINVLKQRQFDCVILDLGLPDMDGFELLDRLRKDLTRMPPIIVYTGRELTEEQTGRLHEYAESIIIKGVRSEERLLDETSIFLHRMVERMPAPKQRIIQNLRNTDEILEERRVLLVEDDMRSAFALGKLLTERGLIVTKAENGQRALDSLKKNTYDIVLMDVMMPVMDGITATKKIREFPHLKDLPIIALTAKAMAEDRDRCLEAGANDYLTKPTDFTRLCSMMRVWLYR